MLLTCFVINIENVILFWCIQDILGVGLEAPLTLCKVIYTLPMLTIKDKGKFSV